MREYMRKVRARQKLERERNEAVNAAIARLSNRAPAGDLCVSDRLARSEAIMADMRLVLEEVKRRLVEVGENGSEAGPPAIRRHAEPPKRPRSPTRFRKCSVYKGPKVPISAGIIE